MKKIIITQEEEEEKLQRKCTLYMKYPFFWRIGDGIITVKGEDLKRGVRNKQGWMSEWVTHKPSRKNVQKIILNFFEKNRSGIQQRLYGRGEEKSKERKRFFAPIN